MNNFIKSIVLVLTLGILSTIIIFSSLFVANMNYTITDEVNTNLQTLDPDLIGADTLASIDALNTTAQAITYPIDLLMLIVFITIVALVTLLAYLAPPLASFNMMSFLIFGIMLVMLAVNFLQQIQDFLREQLITNVFTAVETTLPFYNWYMDTYPYIAVAIMVWAIVVNQLSSMPSNNMEHLEESIREE